MMWPATPKKMEIVTNVVIRYVVTSIWSPLLRKGGTVIEEPGPPARKEIHACMVPNPLRKTSVRIIQTVKLFLKVNAAPLQKLVDLII